MDNIISVASSKQDYDTGFVTRALAEKIAQDNPGKTILTLHKHYGAEHDKVSYEEIHPFSRVPIYPDKEHPDLYSFYADAYFKMSEMHPDLAIHIVKSLAKKYDLVICDAGGQIEDAFALGCQFASKETYYVFDHTMDSVKRLAWLKPLLLKLGIPIGGQIIDHTNGSAEYSYYEYTRTLDLHSMDDTYIINNDRNLDELVLLAKAICNEQFEKSRTNDFKDWGDR